MQTHVRRPSTTASRLSLLIALALLAALLSQTAVPVQAIDLPPETYVEGIEPTMNTLGTWPVGDESISDALPIGFDFTYFGDTVDTFYLYSNGFITLGAGNNPDEGSIAFLTPDPFPTADEPNNIIAAFWDDLDYTSTNGRYLYKTIGTAPNRKLVVQWTNTGFYNVTTPLGTFQIILYEGSNAIQVQYRYLVSQADLAHGSGAGVGIENVDGTVGVQYSLNEVALNSGLAIRFTPDGASYTMNAAAAYDGIVLGASATPAPGSPTQSCPANGGTGPTTPTFSWADAGDGVTYDLIVDDNNTFASPEINATDLTSTSYTPGTPLTDGTTYYWSVIAANGTDSTWSEQWDFTASDTGITPCIPLLSTPAQQAVDVDTIPTFSWSPASYATSYRLIISPNADLSEPVYDQDGITDTTHAVPGLETDTLYYWQVIAINSDGESLSSTRSFTTVNALPEIDLWGDGQAIVDGETAPSVANGTDFGGVVVGQSVTHTFTISNSGMADLNLTDTPEVSISGAAASDFAVTQQPSTPVAASDNTTFQVQFTPGAAGTRSATISIASDDGDENPYDFAIQGVGLQPGYDSSPAPGSIIDVGSVMIGVPVTATLTISETGDVAVNVTSHSVSGTNADDFSVSPASLSIADGDPSQNLTITCTPSATGIRTTTLTVNHDAAGSPASYTLNCTGTHQRIYFPYIPPVGGF